MRVAFFEDRNACDFGPLVQLRPVFELVCGHFTQRERVLRRVGATDWGVFVREELCETYVEQFPEARINDFGWLSEQPTLLINGRWLADRNPLSHNRPESVGVVDSVVVELLVDPAEAALFSGGDWESAIYQIARTRERHTAGGCLVARPWDLVEHNPARIVADFAERTWTGASRLDWPHVEIIGPRDSVYIDPAARVEPFVVIDATQGPVSIDAGACVQAFSRLEGPCHVGQAAQLFRASIRGGTTVGPGTRVGGEVEASILHGSVNKYHEGFLGHSYVCPWVNLGALSTNSDLKNDYSTVRVPLAGKAVETGLVKVGCFLGDHTKTGLGSLFNTGTSIGVMCMILPGGELLPKHVPSFLAVWHGELAEAISLERSLDAARVAMLRRDCELTDAQERLLRRVYERTADERSAALGRVRERSIRTVS